MGQEREQENYIKVVKTQLVRDPYVCEIKSKSRGFRLKSDLFKIVIRVDKANPMILCQHKYLTNDIPISLLLRALGVTNDLNIFQIICGVNLQNSKNIN